MKKLFLYCVLCIVCCLMITGCTSNESKQSQTKSNKKTMDTINDKDDYTDNNDKNTISEYNSANKEIDEEESTELKEKWVIEKDFSLKNKFIKEIIQEKEVPNGYIAIHSIEEFNLIRNNPNANYILMNDIVCDNNYETIETFSGTLDGNGYQILQIQVPLIKNLQGNVKNVGMELMIDITLGREENFDYQYCGGLASEVFYEATINNCYTYGSIQALSNEGENAVGGMIGNHRTAIRDNNLYITNCYNLAEIVVNGAGEKYANKLSVGGLVGSMGSSKLSGRKGGFYNNYNKGTINVEVNNIYSYVSGTGDDISVGGICGDSKDAFEYCYNEGHISVVSNKENRVYCGGIVGDGTEQMSNCRNIGSVEMNTIYDDERLEICSKNASELGNILLNQLPGHCGGIAGYGSDMINCENEGAVKSNYIAGGIVGSSSAKKIQNCYNIGNVEGKAYVGGLFGIWKGGTSGLLDMSSGTANYCYNIGSVQGGIKTGSIGGDMYLQCELNYCYYFKDTLDVLGTPALYSTVKALSKEEMKSQVNWEGFDFEKVWNFKEGYEYPVLKIEKQD